jgi:hypothetical protein
VSGGYVYRGEKIPALKGAYLYSDSCDGLLRAINEVDGKTNQSRDLGVRAGSVVAFGEDHDGELYVVSQNQGLFRIDPA